MDFLREFIAIPIVGIAILLAVFFYRPMVRHSSDHRAAAILAICQDLHSRGWKGEQINYCATALLESAEMGKIHRFDSRIVNLNDFLFELRNIPPTTRGTRIATWKKVAKEVWGWE